MPDLVDRLKEALAGRYAIQRELGRGGMATVYLATDLRHDRPVAIKVLAPEVAAAIGPDRFLREIRTTAQLTHPHILPLLDSGDADGVLFYVMPFVVGESLRDCLGRERQLPVDDALRIGREVADALSYAHSHGVIHRDIKPDNILLESGHAVVADFGIARAIDRAVSERLTGTGLAMGTPAYMSPEQAAGSQELDGRSDLYSLGCVLYEMLAGQPPFLGSTAASLVAQHLAAHPPDVTAIRPSVPAHVAATLQRALAKTPADRFTAVALFAEALAAPAPLAATVPVRAARRPSRRRLVLRALLVVVAALAAVSIGRRLVRSAPPPASDRVVVLPYDNRTGDPALDPVGPMVAEWIAEGLMRTGAVQVVPHFMALEAVAQARGAGGAAVLGRVAERTQSGIAVTGSFYRRGHDLEFHSEVVEVASGTPLATIAPVSGSAADPRRAIDSARIQVMGALATRLSPLVGWELPPTVQPPTYEAAQAYARGMEEWLRSNMSVAARWFERAYASDTTYLRSLMTAASAHGSAGERAQSDSLLRVVSARRDELAPYDRYRLDFALAGMNGDVPGRLVAARAAVQLVPFGTQRTGLILALLENGRPREALRMFDEYLPQIREVGGRWQAIWGEYTEILHLVGAHERELEVAREGRGQAAATLYLLVFEGRSLAALGRLDALRTLIEEILEAVPQPQLTPGAALAEVALEARAHGHGTAAREIVDRDLRWYGDQPAEFRRTAPGRLLLGRLRYLREDWGGADSVFASLATDPAAIVDALGYRGAVAARRGDTASARQFATELAALEQPRLNGRNTCWRARIAAQLGQRAEAVALLQRAMNEGVAYGLWLHRDMDLEPLHGYLPFDELLRPKG